MYSWLHWDCFLAKTQLRSLCYTCPWWDSNPHTVLPAPSPQPGVSTKIPPQRRIWDFSRFPGRNRTYVIQVQSLSAEPAQHGEIKAFALWDYSESNRGLLGFNQTLCRLSYNPIRSRTWTWTRRCLTTHRLTVCSATSYGLCETNHHPKGRMTTCEQAPTSLLDDSIEDSPWWGEP